MHMVLVQTFIIFDTVHFSSFAQSCLTLCDPMDYSTPGLPVHHQLSEFAQNSCPLSRWCHPTISSSVIPFSSRLQSFPASGSFLVSQFFASGSQSIGVSASASVLPMNIQDWFPLGWTGWIPLAVQGTLKSLLQDSLTQTTEIFSFWISLLIFPLSLPEWSMHNINFKTFDGIGYIWVSWISHKWMHYQNLCSVFLQE